MKSNFVSYKISIGWLCGLLLMSSMNLHASYEATEFFQNPNITAANLSPNGEYVSLIRYVNGYQELVVHENSSGSQTTLLDLSSEPEQEASIQSLAWIDNNSVALQFSELNEGVRDLLDTRLSSYLLIIRFSESDTESKEIFKVWTKGWIIDPLPSEPGQFLYAKSGVYSKIYKLNVDALNKEGEPLNKLARVDGGQFVPDNEIISTEGFATRWFMDQTNEPVAVQTYSSGPTISLVTFDENGESTELKTWDYTEESDSQNEDSSSPKRRLFPIEIANDSNSFYCLDFEEDEEKSLYKVNFKTGEEELIYESGSHKIIDIILSSTDNRLIGVKLLRNGQVENEYFEHTENDDISSSQASGSIDTVIDKSLDGSVELIYTESHTAPGRYYVQDQQTKEREIVGSVYPHLTNLPKSILVTSSVNVEGYDIPYLLSIPSNNSEPHPLVVMPHGGPIGVFDDSYFSLYTQFLVANGYAVLRVNFRGSSGYTIELKEAGKREWGGLMLEDIFQATQDVVNKSNIDESRVCVFGSSYGGYAATMLLVRHPDTFKCGINNAGVSDLNLHLSSHDITERQDEWAMEYVGDTLLEYDALKAISLITEAKNLLRPLLIIHGEEDKVVDIEHAYRLKLMLDKHGKSYEWITYADVGHSHSENDQVIQFFSDVKTFLDSHLQPY